MAVTEQIPDVAELGRVHLIGIGGAGMSVIARLLNARGLEVQGSDARRSVVTDSLGQEGIRTWIGHHGAHVADVDTVVVSSAVRPENPELAAAVAAGTRVLHRSQALAALMTDARAVAVAGAHGKTTTSAMTAVVLRTAGLDPSFAIGGSVLTETGALSGGHLGSGDVLVAEADESDGSFLNYEPTIAIVTNVEPDHLDHYGSAQAFEQAFVEFAGRIRPGGWLVVCADDPGARRLGDQFGRSGGQVICYGSAATADIRLVDYAPAPLGTGTARVVFGPAVQSLIRERAGDEHVSSELQLELSVPGLYNALNALASVSAAVLLGVAPEQAIAAVKDFIGTGRRFESRGEVGGVRVVDDYAHHPTEVAALLQAAREVAAPGRVLVLFQPHLFSRTRVFAREFAEALQLADLVVVTDVYAAREDPEPGVGPHLIVDRMAGIGVEIGDRFEAAAWLAEQALPGDLVLTVGAGDVTETGATILAALGQVER